ncbi:SPX domain-containing membrane protein-like protein [Tanacetum coccineum]|uniref:SPX domain-containing membrane protein-like protein n=1 Tax=Tanacetum coccineum TaxID=301880 RepID=A0ABQ5C3J5_9ASTR
MVAFEKKLKDQQIQEWKGYYVNYKLVKKKVENVEQYFRHIQAGGLELRYVLKDFLRMLDNETGWIIVARSADWKPVQFLSFEFVYRIFKKAKAFEPRVSAIFIVSNFITRLQL